MELIDRRLIEKLGIQRTKVRFILRVHITESMPEIVVKIHPLRRTWGHRLKIYLNNLSYIHFKIYNLKRFIKISKESSTSQN